MKEEKNSQGVNNLISSLSLSSSPSLLECHCFIEKQKIKPQMPILKDPNKSLVKRRDLLQKHLFNLKPKVRFDGRKCS
jgi:hypothetical protein